jgi:hypothetical protein
MADVAVYFTLATLPFDVVMITLFKEDDRTLNIVYSFLK